MSSTIRVYTPIAAVAVLLLLSAQRAEVFGQGAQPPPNYGLTAPYAPSFPSLGGNPTATGPSMYSNPYSSQPPPSSCAPGGYYPGYPTYIPPNAANLMGLASLQQSQGQYWQSIESARITREQSRQMSLDTAKKRIETERWYESTKPTAATMMAKERSDDLTWARNYAQNTEIWYGKTLNVLLNSILNSANPMRGPNIYLDESTLKGLNLVNKASDGNLALAKDDGKIFWVESMQEAPFDSSRTRFDKSFSTAIQTARSGEQPPLSMIRDLRADLNSMSSQLDAQIEKFSPSQYISARRQLNQLKDTIKGLSDPLACKSCISSWKQNVHTVADLVGYCQKNGLQFGPAVTPTDYASYSAAYYALRNYERETSMLASR